MHFFYKSERSTVRDLQSLPMRWLVHPMKKRSKLIEGKNYIDFLLLTNKSITVQTDQSTSRI